MFGIALDLSALSWYSSSSSSSSTASHAVSLRGLFVANLTNRTLLVPPLMSHAGSLNIAGVKGCAGEKQNGGVLAQEARKVIY